jgi:hypothetical protein
MSAGPQPIPISDDEVLYRRIPKSTGWFQHEQTPPVDPQAFRPTSADTTGLSLERARSSANPEFKSLNDVAVGPSPHGYVVATLSVRDLRKNGVAIEPRTENAGPGHVELPHLRYDNRRDVKAKSLMNLLALLVLSVEEPQA